jgi:carbonic anhydrase/acetyltransferase-like protein (isoleucine patch superfamily)
MDNSVVESKSIIAAGSVLPKNTIVPEGSVFAGVPAKKIKEIDSGLQNGEIERIAKNYLTYASWFK